MPFGRYWRGSYASDSPAVDDLAAETRSASDRADFALQQLPKLRGELDRLLLACMAMWSLLEEKTGLREEDLVRRMQEIDLADGKPDGKLRGPVRSCRGCKRTVSDRFLRCPYCNSEELEPSAFKEFERPVEKERPKVPLKTPRRRPPV